MPASRLHFVRHGEVFNPRGLLYERLDGFPLSDLGHEMAEAAAEELAGMNREISKLYVSPLERTRQSANANCNTRHKNKTKTFFIMVLIIYDIFKYKL